MKLSLLPIALFVFTTSLGAQNQKAADTPDSKAAWQKIAPYFSPPDEYKN